MANARTGRGKGRGAVPVVKIRHVLVAMVAVACVITGPLLAIRKHVYLRNLAIRREALSDSLTGESKDLARLQMQVQDLSSPARIERIAGQRLNMHYPKSDQIVIIESKPRRRFRSAGDGILALIKRSFGRGSG